MNDAVDLIDFVQEENSISKYFNIALWYTQENISLVQNYYDAVDRDIPFTYGDLIIESSDTLSFFGNSILFVSTQEERIIATFPISIKGTNREFKNLLFNHIYDLNNTNSK